MSCWSLNLRPDLLMILHLLINKTIPSYDVVLTTQQLHSGTAFHYKMKGM